MVDSSLSFWHGKRVLITGHTGFKGSWLCTILAEAGAEVTGYALEPPTNPSLFAICGVEKQITSVIGDIRDYDTLQKVFADFRPEIVIHMAAQPLVLDSYKDPRYTYETNVMGTVNALECVRLIDSVKSVLNVTTDKVYYNDERAIGFTEDQPLDGFDPYSNSKSCSELVTHSYKNSFFTSGRCAVSTARAGNVIGGGDFASNRIVPDCVRAAILSKPIIVRNPYSVRPYQHVLEPLFAYLMIVRKQYEDRSYSGWYNIGPDDCDCITTGALADLFCKAWSGGLTWEDRFAGGPHEASCLKLDCTKLKTVFHWQPRWHIDKAMEKTVEWTKVWQSNCDVKACMVKQIKEYLGE